MLTKGAIDYLTPLTYLKSAERLSCYLPLGGIYWADEIPDFEVFTQLAEEDRIGILRLFRIRFALWNGHELNDDETAFLEAARKLVPDYGLFQRLELSPGDRLAHEQMEQEVIGFFLDLAGDDGEIVVTEEAGLHRLQVKWPNQGDQTGPNNPEVEDRKPVGH